MLFEACDSHYVPLSFSLLRTFSLSVFIVDALLNDDEIMARYDYDDDNDNEDSYDADDRSMMTVALPPSRHLHHYHLFHIATCISLSSRE